jgi:hypothetical protein
MCTLIIDDAFLCAEAFKYPFIYLLQIKKYIYKKKVYDYIISSFVVDVHSTLLHFILPFLIKN